MRRLLGLLTVAALSLSGTMAPAADFEIPDVPYESFTLDNGMTVIVHEDHKAPIVAVNIWYHVGSKNEKPGKTGFAHLFEHLMFNGSENYNFDYFKIMERIGATELNGTTWFDRTNYFQNVPTNALDLTLWMESDRMGHLLGAIDQERLDEQRGVVQNEKRQGLNQPYGEVRVLIPPAAYPAAHPYSWSTIGSMEDLKAASLEDVQEWFKTYYGAANAVLVLAGDIDVETAKQKASLYFGDIPSGPPVTKQEAWIAKRSADQRIALQDRVAQARIYKQWNVPQWGTPENEHLGLVSSILTEGKNSRLFKRLVYDDQIATDVVSFVWPFEISGQFRIYATAQPGGDLAAVEKAVDEEIRRFIEEGPTEAELERVKTQQFAEFVRNIEGVGGFGGKSDLLARHRVYGGDPGFYKQRLEWMKTATVGDVRTAAADWLSAGQLAVEVHPFDDYQVAETGADRSALPDTGEAPAADFPDIQRTALDNGLEIILAERHAAPLVEFRLLVDAGYASDQHAVPGTARLAMDVLDEGTASRSALEISDELAMLGAELSTSSNLDLSAVQLSALKANLAESLDLFADVVLNPAFPETEFARLKQQQLARIQREKKTPIQMALRVFPGLLFGEGHAYATPFTGSGTEESVASISRTTLTGFHGSLFKPNNATLVVVGDTTMDEIVPMIEKRFKKWKTGEVPTKDLSEVAIRKGQSIYLIDRPGSEQSVLLAGHLAPPKANPDEVAIETMNTVLGGDFTSRVNMNLREDKGWSYGAGTFIPGARGQRIFLAFAPVQTDKTKESIQELTKELAGLIGDKPATEEEVARAKDSRTLTLPGQWETVADVAGSLSELVRFGYSDDHFDSYAGKVRGLSQAAVANAAKSVLHPDDVVWVIVGDRSEIEDGIRELGIAQIELLDADGNRIGE
ncbi:MAG: insulinase family protein [bacterium]|nr:insulinase family protein [bacterium]